MLDMVDVGHAGMARRVAALKGTTSLTPAICRSDSPMTWSCADKQLNRGVSEIALSPLEQRMTVFAVTAVDMAGLVREGWLYHDDVVDRLRDAAEAYDLVDVYGEDRVQEVLADAMQRARSPQEINPSISTPLAQVGRSLIVRRASDITIEKIEWLWPDRIAIGKQTLIVGEPGLGKSQFTSFLTAAVTTGGDIMWPCGEGRAPIGSVIILSAEDDAADTIRPRLDAAGAEATKVLIVSAVRAEDGKGRRSFNLQADLDLLEREIVNAGDVRLVVIDPISSYMGKVDSHKNADVRSVLEPVGEMAARLRVAVVSVTHKSKGKGNSAINAAIGSIGFTGVVRSAFMVEKDPEDQDRRLFLSIKNNIAKDPGTLAFRIGQHLLPGDIPASAIAWDGERVAVTADQVMAANENGNDRPAQAEAEAFLRDILACGRMPAKELKAEAAAAGVSWRTIERAKKAIGIKAEREAESGDGIAGTGRWYWSLPDGGSIQPKTAKIAYDRHENNVAALGEFGGLRGEERQ